MVMERTVLWVAGAFSWLNASLSTNSTFSTVRVVRFLPLPGFRSTVPVSSIFLNNLITDDRHQPLFKNSFRSLFAPFFYCHSVDVSNGLCWKLQFFSVPSQSLINLTISRIFRNGFGISCKYGHCC